MCRFCSKLMHIIIKISQFDGNNNFLQGHKSTSTNRVFTCYAQYKKSKESSRLKITQSEISFLPTQEYPSK